MSDHTRGFVCEVITRQCANFNSVDIMAWISKYIPLLNVDVIADILCPNHDVGSANSC